MVPFHAKHICVIALLHGGVSAHLPTCSMLLRLAASFHGTLSHKAFCESPPCCVAVRLQSVPPHVVKAAEKAAEAFTLRLPYEQAVSADRPADAGCVPDKPADAKWTQLRAVPFQSRIFRPALMHFLAGIFWPF
eukprot:1139140-Pelagomonas_calceolata.AAC.4